jgi:hypothetical protein
MNHKFCSEMHTWAPAREIMPPPSHSILKKIKTEKKKEIHQILIPQIKIL